MSNSGSKRPPEDEDSSSDDDLGPALPSAPDDLARPKKKRRILQHESLYVAALPSGLRYSKSLMHKDQLSFVTFTPQTDFLITSGSEGQVSFWKKSKTRGDIEFVKEFRAHGNPGTSNDINLKSVSVSWDGRLFATAATDKTVKIWDIINFDLVAVVNLEKVPTCIAWVHGRGSPNALIAVANEADGEIAVYDANASSTEPAFRPARGKLHRAPVVAMAYNTRYDVVVSADSRGMVEYWRPDATGAHPGLAASLWNVKSNTSLFEFKKSKSVPTSITISPSGSQFSTFSLPDRMVRVFDFATGKLYRAYDESISTLSASQQAGTSPVPSMDNAEFQRRLSAERDLETHLSDALAPLRTRLNIPFDESGHFIFVPSPIGIKLLNLKTNRVLRVYGSSESFRPLNISVYQGAPNENAVVTVEMAASENPLLRDAEARDSILVSTAAAKVRFYLFTHVNEPERSSRDVQNERPRNVAAGKASANGRLTDSQNIAATSAVLHTTLGDIDLRLFPNAAPKTVENFVTHARKGYYNNIIFHRVIKKFMIQTGDPLGDGTGGESIWGREFEDEFSPNHKHDKPYTLSMANAGPNTNGSQFFITTEKTPWLDGKHTVFGRVTRGSDVVHRIENVRTHKEKPTEDIKIVNIEVGSE